MTESDKEALFRAGVKYMDITDFPHPPVSLNAAWTPCKNRFISYPSISLTLLI